MKKFTDLHLIPSLKDLAELKEMLNTASKLGFYAVAISFTRHAKEDIKNVREACRGVGLDFIPRADVSPQKPFHLTNFLRRFRGDFEVIAVNCTSKTITHRALKDDRVDIIYFPAFCPRNLFYLTEARLASDSNTSLELNMSDLLQFTGLERANYIARLRREVFAAQKFRVPIIISSGAKKWHLLRAPQDLAYLATLIGMEIGDAKEAVSKNPWSIIERNRSKLSPKHIAPGVRLV